MSKDGEVTTADIVTYWFSEDVKPKWFEGGDAFDDELRRRFLPAWRQARDGALDHWTSTPEGVLALVLLLDQIPRNCHRGTTEAFSTDAEALHWANWAVEQGIDRSFGDDQRQFLYLPFMHSETLADQERGMQLYAALGLDSPLDYMRRHRDIIARFGRFPHRNDILGRPSTPEEVEFLKQPGSRF